MKKLKILHKTDINGSGPVSGQHVNLLHQKTTADDDLPCLVCLCVSFCLCVCLRVSVFLWVGLCVMSYVSCVFCRLLGITHFVQFNCAEPWRMSSVPNVKWTAYANICLLISLYFTLTIELRRSHHKVYTQFICSLYRYCGKTVRNNFARFQILATFLQLYGSGG